MRYKSKIFAVLLFLCLFIAGWELGISPIKQSIETTKKDAKTIVKKFLSIPYIKIPANYITKNQYKIDILHYDLDIKLDTREKELTGTAILTGTALNKNINSIDLNLFENMKVSGVFINGTKAEFIHKGTKLSLFPGSLANDTFNIKIDYKGKPKKEGLSAFVFGEINGRSVVYNLSEPTYASTWFPCNDIPTDKAQLDIRITNDSSNISISNGVLEDVELNGDQKTYHWKTYYPVSTYLIAVYSSDYTNFNDYYISRDKLDTMAVQYYVFSDQLENAKKDFKEHPEMIKIFSDLFGEYPFIKEKYGVAEFLWQAGAMENQTITGIGSNFVSGRDFYSDIYVHELAHHWWGNCVGPATWKDIWLNEGFATYSEALYYEALTGPKALRSTMLAKFEETFPGTLYDPSSLFNSTVYDKGAWVLHMLRHETGDSVFFKILREYFDKYKYSNASTSDFKEVCENISGKNLDKFFEQWVYEGEGLPDITFEWKQKKNIFSLELEQIQEKYSPYSLNVDVKLIFEDDSEAVHHFKLDEKKKLFEVVVDKKVVNIEPDPDTWLLANFINLESNY